MKRQLLLVGMVLVLAFCGQAMAADLLPPPSSGELSPVLACFYECKPGPKKHKGQTWEEVTTLLLVNQNAVQNCITNVVANIVFLDGNENILGGSIDGYGANLSQEDVDEINVCRTLQAAGLPVPEAGLIQVYLTQPAHGGVYAWMKNILGKFKVMVDEPFAGRVSGIAKTECRVVPPEVATPEQIAELLLDSGARDDVSLILIEDTDDPI